MLEYLKGFLNATDPEKSLKHAAYAVVIASSVFWLTLSLCMKKELDANWIAAYTILVGAVTYAKTKHSVPSGKQPTGE